MRPKTDNPVILGLHGYWDALRNGRKAPRRADFDPMRVPRLLPRVFLYDVLPTPCAHGPVDFRFRLVGTEIAAMLGSDPTGLRFEQVYSEERIARIYSDTLSVAETLEPHHVESRDAGWIGRDIVSYERILLPFSEDQQTANMILGIATFHASKPVSYYPAFVRAAT